MSFKLVLFVSLLKLSDLKSMEQTFLKEPESISVKEGESFTLSCSVKNKVGVLQWTKDDFGLGTSRSLVGYDRYKMVGKEGIAWNLQVTNATLEDDAKFQCQVGATERLGPIRSKYAVVEILSLPLPPVITTGPTMVVREGETGLVQCISKGGKPASVIKWRINGKIIEEGIEEKVAKMVDGKRSMTVSTLSFLASADMSGDSLECEATNEAFKVVNKIDTKLIVQYKPIVKVSVNSESIYEGDKIKIICEAEANPSEVEYEWSIHGNEIREAYGRDEIVIEASRDMHGGLVKCSAKNKIGKSFDEIKMNINCKYEYSKKSKIENPIIYFRFSRLYCVA